jgi:hypothetical protein
VRIVFRQSGGVAGLIRGCELESDELPPDQRRRLQQLVDACDLASLEGGRSPSARDAMTYQLRIEQPKGSVSVRFDESALPADCERLVDFLQPYLGPREPE